MAEYTQNLSLKKPDKTEQYNIADFNENFDKIDNFAGLTPPKALTSDKLTTGANINGIKFDGSKNVITGLGKYSNQEIYNSTNVVYDFIDEELKVFRSLKDDNKGNSLTNTTYWEEVELGSALKDIRTEEKLQYWTGTRSQYDAITTKDNNTIYNITDDTDVTLTLLETLYPVGAIYIGTMSTCPLQVLGVGNWLLKASDRVLQGAGANSVGSTVEAGLPNIDGTMGIVFHGATQPTGAIYNADGSWSLSNTGITSGSGSGYNVLGFDASKTNSIYGNSDTVQPPAYIVNIWERIS